MHPRETAARNARKPAVVMAERGDVVDYAALAGRADQCARLLRSLGLREGDGIALCLPNESRYFEVCWGAHNAGLYFTPVSSRLRKAEIEYIVRDCDARAFVASGALPEVEGLPGVLGGDCTCLLADGGMDGYADYEAVMASMPAQPVDEGRQGTPMMYSSGTTGRPKGIKPPLSEAGVSELAPLPSKLRELYGFDEKTVYLSTAPLYHAAPLKFALAVLAVGGTVIVMEKFDAQRALELIERHRVTHAQWVPTMFVRLLALPEATRSRYDLSSLQVAMHSAAPCPVNVKERMLEWWGPRIHEYYSGSESIGLCAIGPVEWLAHKGSVGRAVRGVVHVVDEAGREVAPGETGTIYFEAATPLRYHKDPGKTARACNERGWATMGDIGHVDAEGYLYLTDRRDFVIISGGVNIYPQEAENVLDAHPLVADVAVFGVPNEEYGEEVKAVVVPAAGASADAALERALIDHCRQRLSALKCPRSIDFAGELPREPTGKLMKQRLRQEYWTGTGAGP